MRIMFVCMCMYVYVCVCMYVYQGSKFHLSVSPGQVDFPPDNKITNICCPSDNLDRGSIARQILVSDFNSISLLRYRQA